MFVILPVVISVFVVVFIIITFKRVGVFGPSKAKRELAAKLIATGEKATATILSVQPTGTVVNNINIQCILQFRIDPLRGGQPFAGEKKSLISQAAMPRIGDVWPCWFNPANPLEFAVGQPTAITPEQIALYHEFGIPHPMDQQQQYNQQFPQQGYPQQQPGYGQQQGYPQQGYPQQQPGYGQPQAPGYPPQQ